MVVQLLFCTINYYTCRLYRMASFLLQPKSDGSPGPEPIEYGFVDVAPEVLSDTLVHIIHNIIGLCTIVHNICTIMYGYCAGRHSLAGEGIRRNRSSNRT